MDALRMARPLLLTSCIAAALASVGCATTYTPSPAERLPAMAGTGRGGPVDVMARSFDTRALARDPDRPLLELIERFWPNVTRPPWMLRAGTTRELDVIGVYANGMFLGGLDAIRSIPSGRAAKVRRITPSEEQMAFGRQHSAGALVIDWARF